MSRIVETYDGVGKLLSDSGVVLAIGTVTILRDVEARCRSRRVSGTPRATAPGMSKGYNGHRSWAAWNVSLWIGNDEGLYRAALDCIRRERTKDDAARELLGFLPEKTPDGARYTFTSVRAALAGLT